MTSNGNTVNKILINNFIKETDKTTTAKVFLNSLQEAQNGEQIKTLEAIAKKHKIEI